MSHIVKSHLKMSHILMSHVTHCQVTLKNESSHNIDRSRHSFREKIGGKKNRNESIITHI